jgi:predicted nucleic acid-binding protein
VIVAVLDTNVLASSVAGIAREESTPGEILRRWRAKVFTLVVSEPILTELARTLNNPYFEADYPSPKLKQLSRGCEPTPASSRSLCTSRA